MSNNNFFKFNKTEPIIKSIDSNYEKLKKEMNNQPLNKKTNTYLKKGGGKLASDYQYQDTKCSIKRRESIIRDQNKIENNPYYIHDPISYRFRK
tara:strand:+ start:225 stop:506 length:282 start_codon:yes stop_codon:yes gene_type:complete